MLNEAIRAIIDLLKIKKDVKKTDLEIQKLDRENRRADSRIEVASLREIKKYDPKVREILRIAKKNTERNHQVLTHRVRYKKDTSNRTSSGWWFFALIVLAVLAILLLVH